MAGPFMCPRFSNISIWRRPWSKSLEPVDQVSGFVLGREIVQLDHVTKLVNVDGGVGGLEGQVIHLKKSLSIKPWPLARNISMDILNKK